jgi:NAD+ synthase (glutamine-hydrolysing)
MTPRYVEQYNLPPALQKHQGVRQVPIGDVVLSLNDTTVAAETCEELFTPQAPHINMYVPHLIIQIDLL